MQNRSILFLTLGGRELYSLVKNLAFPNVPAELPCREFILQLNKQASKCNYGDRLEEQLWDRLIAGINNISSQGKMLKKKDITFAEARKICEQSDDLCAATNADTPVLFHLKSTKPLRDVPSVHNSPQVPQVPSSSRTQPKAAINRCLSCGEYHPRSTCRFRNAAYHACGKMGHIRKVCRMPKCSLVDSHIPTADENSSPIYTLHTTKPKSQFVSAPLRFESGMEH
ncbi:unnamed protein product [Echinostoma caproni]|uniref:CCHC-type domain-containing protein n=1 Tax=Echinostoma caproni TaxID=27848 RepID=A0A183AV20_9TREM|nr:unnamed protein product [Echinostoma caproni]